MTEHLTSAQYRETVKAPKKGRFPRSPKSERTADGIVFDSKAEMLRYRVLKFREIAGLIFDLELQPKFPVEINGHPYTTVKLDFSYKLKSGEVIFEDVKSSGTRKEPDWRLRKKAVELYYGIEVKEVTK